MAPGGPDAVWRVDGGTICHANHFVQPHRSFKDLALLDGRESPLRQASAARSVSTDPIGTREIESALRAHAGSPLGEGSVCAHGDPSEPPEADYVTVAGIIADVTTGTLHLTHGNPCTAPFNTFDLMSLLG